MTAIVAPGRRARTAWMAKVPMPLLPPWISTVSPSARAAGAEEVVVDGARHPGKPSAVISSIPSGTGITWPAGTSAADGVAAAGEQGAPPRPTENPSTPGPAAEIRSLH